jgi:poly-gamma-glutamate synthesis protein (capsule biosynthesis protein)
MGRRTFALAIVAALVIDGAGLVGAPGAARADDPPPPPPPPELRHLTMAFTGDIIPLPSLIIRAQYLAHGKGYDFRPYLADMAPLISSVDLAVCHLEIPISPPGKRWTGGPRWSTPPEIARALVDTGYDRCSTASNHTLDKDGPGIDATLNAFDAVGLGHSGSARTPEEAVASVFEVNGVKIAHLSYSFGFNNHPLPPGQPWRTNKINEARILADAADVRTRGAELVFVSLHWGAEQSLKPIAFQTTLADHLTKSGLIDLIVGHHPHVLEPIVQVNGKWVMYSLGNFMSNHRPETDWPIWCEDGAVVTVDVTELPGGGFTVGRPVVHPTWSQPRTYVVWDSLAHQKDPKLSASDRRRLRRSLARTTAILGAFFPT